MDSKALYLLAQFDAETERRLSSYYEFLQEHGFEGRQTKGIPYHFTLGSYGVEYEEQLIEQLHTTCLETASFDIRLGHIGLFGLNVLFIEPNMNFELLNLQRSFFNDCGKGDHLWTAHATLLIDEPDTILKALPMVAEKFEPFCAKIESIGLYEFFPARLIKECNLANTRP